MYNNMSSNMSKKNEVDKIAETKKKIKEIILSNNTSLDYEPISFPSTNTNRNNSNLRSESTELDQRFLSNNKSR